MNTPTPTDERESTRLPGTEQSAASRGYTSLGQITSDVETGMERAEGGGGVLHVLSLGADVQSTTMALMAARGELTPMPAAAIFADTGDEPKAVYDHLAWLEKELPFPVHRVTKGDLMAENLKIARSKKSGKLYMKGKIPAFAEGGRHRVG